MLEEKIKHRVEITEEGVIQIREAHCIYKDGKMIAKSYHRKAIAPEGDTSKEIQLVKDIAPKVWTDEVKNNWKKKKGIKDE